MSIAPAAGGAAAAALRSSVTTSPLILVALATCRFHTSEVPLEIVSPPGSSQPSAKGEMSQHRSPTTTAGHVEFKHEGLPGLGLQHGRPFPFGQHGGVAFHGAMQPAVPWRYTSLSPAADASNVSSRYEEEEDDALPRSTARTNAGPVVTSNGAVRDSSSCRCCKRRIASDRRRPSSSLRGE